MTFVFTRLSLELYLILCCLFAPVDQKTFEIEMRENGRETGITLYAARTEQGFSIFSDRERKKEAVVISKTGERYVITPNQEGRPKEFAVDNAAVGIKPLAEDGTYQKTIDQMPVTFERKDGVSSIYQDRKNKVFLVRQGR